jgi:septal ring factor EnvC (AmiA/AmiB activator)
MKRKNKIIYIMTSLILFLTFLMMYLIIQHFMGTTIIEGLSSCDSDQHDLTYKNTATIEQQQKEIADFKKSIKSRLAVLQTQITGFNISIQKNKAAVAKNATTIKSTVKDINDARKKKAKELNAVSG